MGKHCQICAEDATQVVIMGGPRNRCESCATVPYDVACAHTGRGSYHLVVASKKGLKAPRIRRKQGETLCGQQVAILAGGADLAKMNWHGCHRCMEILERIDPELYRLMLDTRTRAWWAAVKG